MSKLKTVTLEMSLDFDVKDGCITWSGSSIGWVDSRGRSLNSLDFPSTKNLLIHYLSKYIEGKNDDDKLAIVNTLKQNRP